MNLHKRKQSAGNFTVEAALIFPVILIAIFALIYMSLLLYQQAYIQSIADRTVELGTMTWDNLDKDVFTGYVSGKGLQNEGLYWRLKDSSKQLKEDRLKAYAEARAGKNAVLGGTSTAHIDIQDYIVYKKLTIDITNEQEIPIGDLLKVFGMGRMFILKAHAEAVINEPVEFIRNTDFMLDIEKEIEIKNPQAAKAAGGIRNAIQKMQEGLNKFFQ